MSGQDASLTGSGIRRDLHLWPPALPKPTTVDTHQISVVSEMVDRAQRDPISDRRLSEPRRSFRKLG